MVWRGAIRSLMHLGNIHSNTAAGRVYAVLCARDGDWISGWDLAQAARTTAVSTRVSEVRMQLFGATVETRRDRDGYWYRLVAERGQMELAGV